MAKQKNIMIPVSTFVRQAAFMADKTLNEFIQGAVYMAAHQTMNDANEALCNAGVRSRAMQEHKAKARIDREQAKLRGKSARQQSNGVAPIKWVDLEPAQETVHYVSPPMPNEAKRERAIIKHESTGETGSRIKGLIADYKGDFFAKHRRHTTLRDVHVWQCHRDVHGCGITADTSDLKTWEQVISRMYEKEKTSV